MDGEGLLQQSSCLILIIHLDISFHLRWFASILESASLDSVVDLLSCVFVFRWLFWELNVRKGWICTCLQDLLGNSLLALSFKVFTWLRWLLFSRWVLHHLIRIFIAIHWLAWSNLLLFGQNRFNTLIIRCNQMFTLATVVLLRWIVWHRWRIWLPEHTEVS